MSHGDSIVMELVEIKHQPAKKEEFAPPHVHKKQIKAVKRKPVRKWTFFYV